MPLLLLLLLLPPKRGQNKDKLAINTSRKDDTAASREREREREREVLVSLGSGDLESKCMGCVNACVRVRACELP